MSTEEKEESSMHSAFSHSFWSVRWWGSILHLVKACTVGWNFSPSLWRPALEVKSLTPACHDGWWRQGRPLNLLSAWLFLRESQIHPQRPPPHYNTEAADLCCAFLDHSPAGGPDFKKVLIDEWKYLYSQGTCHRQPGLFSPRSFLSFVVFSWKTAGLGSNERLFTELQL
jgi:hypothetical protein